MKAKVKVYNILISIDDAYLDRAIETITSFKNHNDVFFNVHILYEELKDKTISELEKYIKDNNIGKLTLIKADLKNVKLPINITYISKVTYYRLFAPYFINEDRLLYIDCDLICNGSIEEFYNMDFEGNAIIACPNMLDSSKEYLDSVMKSDIGISLDDTYVNAGVLLINPEAYRNYISFDDLVDFINNTKLPLNFQDQDVINHVFHQTIKLASSDYNFQMNGVDEGEENFNAPIIHFSEYYKPWNNDYYSTRKASSYYDFLLKNKKDEKVIDLIDHHLLNETGRLSDINIDNDDEIDIIIPIYNASKTIEKCLDSIKNQVDIPKLNIYLIDDASTCSYDGILKKFNSLNISYVKLEKNSGPGVARNKGLGVSSGKYVVFVDSDDIFSSRHSLSTLYKLIKKDDVDLVKTTIYRATNDSYTLYTFDDFGLHGKIYKRSFIDEHKLRFNNSYFFEDTAFNLFYGYFDAKVSNYDLLTYLWNNSDESLTSTKKADYLSLAKNITTNYKHYLKESDKSMFYANYFLSLKWMNFAKTNLVSDAEYRKFIKEFTKLFELFKSEYKGIYYDDLYKYISDRYEFYSIIKMIKDASKEYIKKHSVDDLTEHEKSLIEIPYYPLDYECTIESKIYPQLIDKYNKNYYSDYKSVSSILPTAFYSFGYCAKILPPINSNWGCKNVSIGSGTYINSNITFVDDNDIIIGNDVLVGPNVTFCTTSHPIDPATRTKIISKPIVIGDNVWIGAGTIILQGVTIGKNSVIGAGSVVTKSIPENVVAFGNPCKVQKDID